MLFFMHFFPKESGGYFESEKVFKECFSLILNIILKYYPIYKLISLDLNRNNEEGRSDIIVCIFQTKLMRWGSENFRHTCEVHSWCGAQQRLESGWSAFSMGSPSRTTASTASTLITWDFIKSPQEPYKVGAINLIFQMTRLRLKGGT